MRRAQIMACVGVALGEAVTMRPGKVVAGLEPEHTNAFLQQLARAAHLGADVSASAVERARMGEMAPMTNVGAPAPALPPQEPEADAGALEQQGEAAREERRQRRQRQQEEQERQTHQQARMDDDPRREIGAPAQRTAPQRPSSARRAPPKVKSTDVSARKVGGTAPVPVVRSKMAEDDAATAGRTGPPAAGAVAGAVPAVAVIGEGEGDDDDDTEVVVVTGDVDAPAASVEGAGKLVRDIVAAKSELTDAAGAAVPEGEDDMGPGIVIKSRRKGSSARVQSGAAQGGKGISQDMAGASVRKMEEVGAIKDAVQSLVQSTTPLGKVIDYLQEDLVNMAKEMAFWVSEERAYARRVDEERRATEDITAGFEGQRRELDDEVAAMEAKIAAARAELMHNDGKIKRMIQGMVA